jgi:hypothetical protein
MRSSVCLSAILLSTVACSPLDATVVGSYSAWLANGSSGTVAEDELNLAEATVLDCTADALPGNAQDCSSLDPEYYTWLQDDGYYLLEGTFDPWRSEALVSSEGDFLLTFHHDLGDGQDFRIAFAVNPTFAPSVCAQDDEGNAVTSLVDGADWTEQWSADEGGMYIYYLNSGSYQLNPNDSDDYWSLPDDWLSGFSNSKFAAEEFNSVPSLWGDYDSGNPSGWYVSLDADEPDWSAYEAQVAEVEALADTWEAELENQGMTSQDFELRVVENSWREPNGSAAGIDGWVSMEHSWVRLDTHEAIEVGDSVSGDFQIFFQAIESGSYVLATGSFDVPSVREDKWGYPVAEDQKREENNTPDCE